MDVSKIQKLASLLEEALKSAVVTKHLDWLPTLTLNEYRRNLFIIWQSFNPNLRMQMLPYAPQVEDAALRKELVDLIRSELSEYISEDRIQAASVFVRRGGPTHGFHLEALVSHLLKIAIVRGAQNAAHAFYERTHMTQAPYLNIGLLDGVKMEQETQVCEGIRLVPLPDSESALPPYLNWAFTDTAKDLLRRTVIVVEQSVSPLFAKPVSSDLVSTDFIPHEFASVVACPEFPEFNLYEFCDVLSLVCDNFVRCQAAWEHMDEVDIANINTGGGGVHGSIGASTGKQVTILETDVQEALSLYRARYRLDAAVAKKLKVSIDRWLKSKRSSVVDAFIDLGIALESLYLEDIDGGGELGFRLGLRAARFLGSNVEERKSLMREMREIYRCRSDAVHTGDLRSNEPSVSNIKERADQLCLQSIVKIIKNEGFPNWDELTLGNS